MSWFAFVTRNEEAVLVGFKDAMKLIFAKSMTKDLHAVRIKLVRPFACSSKFTAILQEVLANMQVGAGCWILTAAMLSISFIVMRAYLNYIKLQGYVLCVVTCDVESIFL